MSIPPPPPPPPAPPPLPPQGQGQDQPYWGGQPPYGYQQPTTNGLAIAALIGAIFLAPLGIVLGHISLSQIKRTGEQGRGLAMAGLIIGYIFTAIWVLSIVWLLVIAGTVANAFSDYDSESTSSDYYSTQATHSYSTYTTTTTPNYNSSSTAEVIENASVGDCISRVLGAENGDGTSSVTVSEASCGTSSATHRVTSRVTSSSSCSNNWVSTDNPVVVLCISEE